MRNLSIAMAMLILCEALALGSNITVFDGGKKEQAASLDAPAYYDVVNLSIPAECHILKATVDVAGVPVGGAYPDGVSVSLDGTTIWEFNGTGYGPLGMQDEFVNGMVDWCSCLGHSGGANSTIMRLPKKAAIGNATVELECSGRGALELYKNFIGGVVGDSFGDSVSCAGDINGDGFDDVIVGAPYNNSGGHWAGRAYIFYGGPSINSTPDMILNGTVESGRFGFSVAGAGDVNMDGFDDIIIGAYGADRAYIYYGGRSMNSTPDVVLGGAAAGDWFGISVSGAGDVNNDSYGDVVVGASANKSIGMWTGRAYVYYGGPNMDSDADVVFTGETASSNFGYSASGAGDVNRDGYDDIIVGGVGGGACGKAYIYFGGRPMDGTADVVLNGTAADSLFGDSVSSAGDVNRDGFDDVIVGARLDYADGLESGRAYLFYGGKVMNSTADVVLTGEAKDDEYGMSVDGAWDVNEDGYDDVVVGARDAAGGEGRAYVYYGGAPMDNQEDVVLAGPTYREFGESVSGAGDVDRDGCDELVVGATTFSGEASIFKSHAGIKQVSVTVGPISLWDEKQYLNGTVLSKDFGPELDQFVRSSPQSGTDAYGNSFLNVSLWVLGKSGGNLSLSKLRIAYSLNASIPDFSEWLNRYLSAHRSEKDASGNLTVPLAVMSRTAGNVRLANLNVSIDEPPRLFKPVPDRAMDEDSVAPGLIDLWDCFRDDLDAGSKLKFGVELRANGSIVNAEVADNRYVSVNAYKGPQNDNWTGVVGMRLSATDRWNQTAWSNPFNISIRDVPDPPVFTSEPPLTAVAGQEYSYCVTAADGDNDALTFGLGRCPLNMTVNSSSGRLTWMPRVVAGRYAVCIKVTDGMFTTFQDYSILIPNSPPEVRNISLPDAFVGVPYSYLVPGIDNNGDPLSYSIIQALEGMTIDSTTGELNWTPKMVGVFPASVLISDGIEAFVFEFNITVKQGNRDPTVTSSPGSTAHVDGYYYYNLTATDADNDLLTYALVSGPPGMYLENTSGRLSWVPLVSGDFTLLINVMDGKGGIGRQEFVINVTGAIRPVVNILSPSSRNWKGVVTITGTAIKGTREVSRVQICVDSGDWKDAAGTNGWSYPLDTTSMTDGKHKISVRAFDGKEYSDTVWLTVTVSNLGKSEGPSWLVLLAIVVLVAAGVAGYLNYRKRTPMTPAEVQYNGARVGKIDEKGPKAPEGFAIDDLFLMYKDGRLILHTTRRLKADMDASAVAGMLNALQEFVRESVGREKGAELSSMEYGGSKILLEKGTNTIVAAVIVGEEPPGFRDEMKSAAANIESEFGTVLPTWNGVAGELAEARMFLTRLGTFRPSGGTPAEKAQGAVSCKAELEFYQGFVRLKVAVKNDMPTTITRATFTLEFDENALRLDSVEPAFERKGKHVEIGIIDPGEKRTMAFYLDPQICTESQIEGVLTYKDARGSFESVKLARKLASVVCPILHTEENINTAMLKRMAAEELDKKDTKVFSVPVQFPPDKAFELAKAAVQHHDVKLVREFSGGAPFAGEAWYFGKAKGREGRLVIRTRVLGDKGILEFFVASDSMLMLTGMLAELKSDLNKELAAQKGRPEMRQLIAPEEVGAVSSIGTFLERAT